MYWMTHCPRGIYATDASMYQVVPSVIVAPKSENDVIEAIRLATEYQISILARGGGTSLAGQAVNEGMVLDFSKHIGPGSRVPT